MSYSDKKMTKFNIQEIKEIFISNQPIIGGAHLPYIELSNFLSLSDINCT
jgi:N-methylhydantoinase B/oxoprolinase/acetone carboxylase alpha subunit